MEIPEGQLGAAKGKRDLFSPSAVAAKSAPSVEGFIRWRRGKGVGTHLLHAAHLGGMERVAKKSVLGASRRRRGHNGLLPFPPKSPNRNLGIFLGPSAAKRAARPFPPPSFAMELR